MRKVLSTLCVLILISCRSNSGVVESTKKTQQEDLASKYASTITAAELSEHLYIFASDKNEGRLTGEPGQKIASEYLKNFYEESGIKSPQTDGSYFQKVPRKFFDGFYRARGLKDSENILAFIEGSEKPNEVIIISAHLDHIGKDFYGRVFNGADDDGSGTVAILEIAEAFKKAADEGNGPKRSVLFLHVTAEEKGLLGSLYYTLNPSFPLSNTVSNLNIDMIGRVDDKHKDETNYVYLIGSDKLSSELHNLSEYVNTKFTQLELDYRYNDDDDPNRFYYRSDHYNFAQHNIPVIFYFSGTHEDYHQLTDTADKINYEVLEKRAKLIFHTAWEIANRKNKLFVDKAH